MKKVGMMKIDTAFINRCIQTLEKAFKQLQQVEKGSLDYDLYRSATIKEFEIILEQSGNLLKKILKSYLHSPKAVDQIVFKDIFRHAGHHGLLTIDEVKNWLKYRDNRNLTSHNYGAGLAEETLPLLTQFILDAKKLVQVIESFNDPQRRR